VLLELSELVKSLKRFALVLLLLLTVALTVAVLFDQLIATYVQLATIFAQTIRIVIVVFFGLITMLFIRHSKHLVSKYVGVQTASIFQFFMILAVGIIMIFAALHIFDVSPTALLIGGGVVSIVMGLVISTFVGNILAGTLVLTTNPFRVGDTVMINNVPGRVQEITAMVTRIRNDFGGIIVVPNTAIIQGGVIITKFPTQDTNSISRLPYSVGDRVYTTYMNGEGRVTELTSFHTKIMLDSGRELTFMNSSVVQGSVAVARISQVQSEKKNL
jgi:small-conductance mechanosensitive channel